MAALNTDQMRYLPRNTHSRSNHIRSRDCIRSEPGLGWASFRSNEMVTVVHSKVKEEKTYESEHQ